MINEFLSSNVLNVLFILFDLELKNEVAQYFELKSEPFIFNMLILNNLLF